MHWNRFLLQNAAFITSTLKVDHSYHKKNQRDGLETQAKVLMTSVIRPDIYALLWNLSNFTLNILQDFVFAYFKQERQYLWNCQFFNLFKGVINKAKPSRKSPANASVKPFQPKCNGDISAVKNSPNIWC